MTVSGLGWNTRSRTRAVCLAASIVIGIGGVSACSSDNHAHEDTPTAHTTVAAPPADAAYATPAAAVVHATVTETRVPYATSTIGDPSQNYGDLYLPAGAQRTDSIPLVVLIHGGGWRAKYHASSFDGLSRTLAERGVAVYNIEYRRVGSGGGWTHTFSDVVDAYNSIPDLIAAYPQLSSQNVIAVGHSAGAQLAVWAATDRRDNVALGIPETTFRPEAVISLAGPLDLVHAFKADHNAAEQVLGGTPEQQAERYTAVDPIQNIDPTVPVLAVAGTADATVSPTQSTAYVAAVDRDHGVATLELIPGATHQSLVTPGRIGATRVLDLIVNAAGDPELVASGALQGS